MTVGSIAVRTPVGYLSAMVFRASLVAILFAASASAQEQEQAMMDRIMNPNRDKTNPMGEKAFKAAPFSADEFRGAREFGGVKSAAAKEYRTREFFGIRNPWIGKKVYQTEAARELTRFVLSDKGFASKRIEPKASRDAGKHAGSVDGSMDARAFLARGKSQAALNNTYSPGPALSLDQVRELLNRDR